MQAQEFKKQLKRLSPLNSANEQCVRFIEANLGNEQLLVDTLLAEMNRSSLNARARILFFIQHCVGGVGKHKAPAAFNRILAANFDKLIALGVPEQMYPACLANVDSMKRCERSFTLAKLLHKPPQAKPRLFAMTCAHTDAILASCEDISEQRKVYTNRDEVVRRIEEDRERMKRYREYDNANLIGSLGEFELEYKAAHLTKIDRQRIRELNRPLPASQ